MYNYYTYLFIRQKLNRDQFLKVLTCQFYSACLYASAAWLHGANPYKDVRWINAVYYRSLRIAQKDYKMKLSRTKLDELARVRPTTWAKYQSSSIIIKAITRSTPLRLHSVLQQNSYSERQKPKRLKFFNKANFRIGKQCLPNRCGLHMNDIPFDWTDGLSDDLIRIYLKKHFSFI